jgi:hypothetical protein
MKRKLLCLLVICLFCTGMVFANSGSKDKNPEPDLTGSITAFVTGKPIKDVNIIAYSINKKEKVAVSDANGNYSLVDLKPGVYKFVFQKDGYQKVVKEKIILKVNEDYQMNIHMSEDETIFDMIPSPLKFADVF